MATKKRVKTDKNEDRLAINGSFDDVISLSVSNIKPVTTKKKTPLKTTNKNTKGSSK